MKKLTVLFTLALAACGGGGGDSEMGIDGEPDGGGEEEIDTTAPTVLSVSPADGAAGVRSDAVVVIEFSEAMDQLSVQNSLDTSDLGGVTFAWSNSGQTLTITPDAELEYAEGSHPSLVDALLYQVVLGTGAADEAGNHVELGVQTLFTTSRLITMTLHRDNAMTSAGTPSEILGNDEDDLYIGDDGGAGAAIGSRGFITMSLGDLPEDASEILSAELNAFQSGTYGLVYDELGSLLIEHGTFSVAMNNWALATENEINGAFNMAPMSSVGVFMASDEDVNVAVDVTAHVQDDLENRVARNDRSQFLLRLATDLNLDAGKDGVLIGRQQLKLDVVYLTP